MVLPTVVVFALVVVVIWLFLAVASWLLRSRIGKRRALPDTGSVYEKQIPMRQGGGESLGEVMLMAGASAVDITPKESVYLAGHDPNRKSEGLSDKLWARALVLQSSVRPWKLCDDVCPSLCNNRTGDFEVGKTTDESSSLGGGGGGGGGAGGEGERDGGGGEGGQEEEEEALLQKEDDEDMMMTTGIQKRSRKAVEQYGHCDDSQLKGSRVAIVAIDCIGIQGDEMERLRTSIAEMVDARHIIVAATHTHSGPDTLGLWGNPPFVSGLDPDYMSSIRVAAAEAVRRAIENLKPAELASCRATVDSEMMVNLRRPGMIDQEMNVVHVRQSSGGPTICTLMEVACHAEVMPSKGTWVSSDFPHWMREKVEGELGGRAIFVAGALGGLVVPADPSQWSTTTAGQSVRDAIRQEPIQDPSPSPSPSPSLEQNLIDLAVGMPPPFSDETREVRPTVLGAGAGKPQPCAWADTATFGNVLGEKVVKAVRSLQADCDPSRRYERRPDLCIWHMKVAAYSSNWCYFLVRLLGLLNRSVFYGSSWFERSAIWPFGYFLTSVSAVNLGSSLCAVAVPGEISPCLGLRIKHTMRTVGSVPRVMIVGLANDELGYILPYELYDLPLFRYEKTLCCDARIGTTLVEAFTDIAVRMGQRKELSSMEE